MSDHQNDKVAKRVAEQEDGANELNDIFQNILPWQLAEETPGQLLTDYTVKDPNRVKTFIDSLYLFRIGEIAVAVEADDGTATEIIYKRQQALVTAAYQSGFTLATIIIGDGGGTITVYLGVSGTEDTRDVFSRQLQGIYPGKGIDFVKEGTAERILKKALSSKSHGGVITGIPTLRLEGERQTFDLTSVVRSMQGQAFALLSVARPVAKTDGARQVRQIMEIKDRCHSLSVRNMTDSVEATEHESNSASQTQGDNEGINKSAFSSVSGTYGVSYSGALSVMVGGGVGFLESAGQWDQPPIQEPLALPSAGH